MAGIITHLAIANKIVNELPTGIITNEGLFYAGSIAPDLIRMREGVTRVDKKHSHMRDNITDVEFSKKENLTLFNNRVTSFINDNIVKESDIIDLYRGYVVHLLSDEIFLITVRPDFVEKMKALGIQPTDILFRDNIFDDLDRHDFKLVKDNSEMQYIFSLLKNVEPHSVDGYITDKEIKLGINWVLEKNQNEKHEVLDPIYISYEKILTFIDEATDDIISRLSDGVTFPKIF
jgi:hypothetical protein